MLYEDRKSATLPTTHESGTVLIEAALVFPVFLVIMIGTATLGFYFLSAISLQRWSHLLASKAGEFPSYSETAIREERIRKLSSDLRASTVGLSSTKPFLGFNEDSYLEYSRLEGETSPQPGLLSPKFASVLLKGNTLGKAFSREQDFSKRFQFPEVKRGNGTVFDPGFQSSGPQPIDCCGRVGGSSGSCISALVYQCADSAEVGFYGGS